MKRVILISLLLLNTLFLSGQNSQSYSEISNVEYYSIAHVSDGYQKERCLLDVYYPSNGGGFATVVWFHGGGLSGGEKYIPEELREKGICVVSVNYRLYPRVDPNVCVEDAAAAIESTFRNIEKYGGDPSSIFLSGHSAGGYLAAMVGMDKSRLGRYGRDANDVAGIIPFSGHTITHFAVREMMDIPGYQPVIDRMAPIYFVRKDAPPVLLITGDRELELLGRYEENAYFMRMMRVAGHEDTRIMELDGYGHDMTAPAFKLLLNEIQRVVKLKNKSLE